MSAEAGWSDEPINDTDADSLQRENLAKETAQLIERVTASQASKVFALTGPWGSGKTSLALIIEGQLKGHRTGWKTAHFTPWAAADTESMTAEFIAALADILPDDRRTKALELLGQASLHGQPVMVWLRRRVWTSMQSTSENDTRRGQPSEVVMPGYPER